MGSSFPKQLNDGWFVENQKVDSPTDENTSDNFKYELKFKGSHFEFTINHDQRIRREGGGSFKNLTLVLLEGDATAKEDSDKNYVVTFNVKTAMKDKGGYMGIPVRDNEQMGDFTAIYNLSNDTLNITSPPKTQFSELKGILKRVIVKK